MKAVVTSFASGARASQSSDWQSKFVEILPRLRRQLSCAYRGLAPEMRQEAVQEGIVNCLRAFVRLHQQRRLESAYPSSLARYAVLQGCVGRTVCSRLNSHDPLSRYAQLRRRIVVERLDRRSSESGDWLEAYVEDRRASIPDQVAMRIDIPAWLSLLSRRTRRIATDLAIGCSTCEVARKYRLSAGRISQLRQELYRSWLRFQSAAVQPQPAAA